MKPLQMVKSQCDCYQPNGTCLGITVNDRLQPTRFQPEGSKCLLAFEKLKRCPHFESSILPYRPEHKDSRTEARLQADWNEGSHEYRIKTGYLAANIRLCPQCRTSTIGDGRKICDQCKAKNRRETFSKSNHYRKDESQYNSSAKTGVDSQ